jgi:hypothetical protein
VNDEYIFIDGRIVILFLMGCKLPAAADGHILIFYDYRKGRSSRNATEVPHIPATFLWNNTA